MNQDHTMPLPVRLAEGVAARIHEVDRHSQALNAYIQGIADTLEVPPGWQFDRDQLVFLNPQKGDEE